MICSAAPEPVDAPRDDAAQRVRQLVGRQRVGAAHQAAFPVDDLEHALVAQSERQLLREHRVSLGAILHQPSATASGNRSTPRRLRRPRRRCRRSTGAAARRVRGRAGRGSSRRPSAHRRRAGRDVTTSDSRSTSRAIRNNTDHDAESRKPASRMITSSGFSRAAVLQQGYEEVLRLLRAGLAGEAPGDVVVGPLHRQHGLDQGCQLDQLRIGRQHRREAGAPRARIRQRSVDRVEPVEHASPGAVGNRHLQRVGRAHQGEDVAVLRERRGNPAAGLPCPCRPRLRGRRGWPCPCDAAHPAVRSWPRARPAGRSSVSRFTALRSVRSMSVSSGRQISIGSALPFTLMAGSASSPTRCPRGRAVALSQRMPPLAACIRRAARFTTSPITVYSRRRALPTAPQNASPVQTPTELLKPIADEAFLHRHRGTERAFRVVLVRQRRQARARRSATPPCRRR